MLPRKMSFEVDSCTRGFHIKIRSPKDGDVLSCEHELGNQEDPFAVAAKKNCSEIVGHLPRTISYLCSLFLRLNRCITCSITVL